MSYLSNARSWLSVLSDDDVQGIARTIDSEGFYCAPGFLSVDDLHRMRGFVSSAIALGGHQSVSLGRDHLSGSGLDELADIMEFKNFVSRLYTIGLGRPAPAVRFHQVLRCLTGASLSKHSLMFHYDSYFITALIPVEIPEHGKRGDFLMIPNMRGVRSSYLFNLVDKLILDNAVSQWMLRTRASGGRRIKRVAMVPGSLYLFWGYRSIHTNEPVDEGAVRATALFHYGDPHADSYLKRRLGRS